MTFLILAICAGFAWFISTLAAGGGALLLIPIASLLLAPAAVAPTITLTALIANPGRLWLFRRHIDYSLLKWQLPGTLVGTLLGAWFLSELHSDGLLLCIGLFLLSTPLQQRFSKLKRWSHLPRPLFLPISCSVALVSSVAGATGPVMNPFYLAANLTKEQLIATKAVNSLLLQTLKLIAYGSLGILTGNILLAGGMMGIGAIMGVWLAKNHLAKINQARFTQYITAFMLISGVLLIITAFKNLYF
jgi:uncharacterized membrane protein YfcA